MPNRADPTRLRAAYADLLDADAPPDLVRFLGDLEAAHTAPALPAAVQATLDRPTWDAPTPLPAPVHPFRRSTLPRWVTTPRPGPGPDRWRRWWGSFVSAANVTVTTLCILGVIALSAIVLYNRPARGGAGGAAAQATLLYPGTLNGRAGIIAGGTDGGDARLVVLGEYHGVAASPDGKRFLAYGGGGRVDLYGAAGNLLRRYDLGGTLPLTAYWAPDSRHAAIYTRAGGTAASEEGDFGTWLLDERGARELRLGARTSVGTLSGTGAWSVGGRLLLEVIPSDSNGDGRITWADEHELWTADAGGRDARRLYRGPYHALGWSGIGTTVYLLGDFARIPGGRDETGPTRLLAIDDRSGAQRTIATADGLARQLRRTPRADGALPTLAFSWPADAAATPAGDRIALWLAASDNFVASPLKDPPYLTIVDEAGRVVGQHRAEEGARPHYIAWAPDGARLAYSHTYGSAGSLAQVRVVAATGGESAPAPPVFTGLNSMQAEGTSLRWSPDGRQLAVLRDGRVVVSTGPTPDDVRVLPGTSTGWPNWQPRPAR